ncbi:MAG: hypothetical protein IJ447_07040 [Clostridia bacterium]|nr:hypothetical protein [Clostridia bacterium]
MKYYLGIDGGGTKTVAVICDEKGTLVSKFVGNSINYNAVGTDTARKNLKDTVDGVLDGKDICLSSAFIGMPALSERADEALTAKLCGGIIDCPKITMDSDVYIGLEAMKPSGSAAMVVSGTGSMAVGRLDDGTVIHTGGWGYILGDEGSGYAIALDGIKAAICGAEESAEKTALTQKMLEHFKVNDILSLIDIFYDPPLSNSEIARFAPAVFECAKNGDTVAKSIGKSHAKLLANTVSALLKKMPCGTPLGLWGGIMINCDEFRNEFTALIKEKYPETEIGILKYPPEYGAVFAAMKEDGIDIGGIL